MTATRSYGIIQDDLIELLRARGVAAMIAATARVVVAMAKPEARESQARAIEIVLRWSRNEATVAEVREAGKAMEFERHKAAMVVCSAVPGARIMAYDAEGRGPFGLWVESPPAGLTLSEYSDFYELTMCTCALQGIVDIVPRNLNTDLWDEAREDVAARIVKLLAEAAEQDPRR